MKVTEHRHQQRRTITLPEPHMGLLEELAREHFHGNFSAMLKDLVETHPVTKSRLPSSPLATSPVV